jgi:transcriptional regulator with XRE-family HTH domain
VSASEKLPILAPLIKSVATPMPETFNDSVMEKTTLGQALIERRTSLEIDKARAARIIGIARSTYSAYELDVRRIAPESLPALGKFLDASLDDLVHLYGATCMAQARETLLHHMFHSDPPVVEVLPVPPSPPSLASRANLEKDDGDRDLSVLKRVFFDVVTTSGHEIAPAFATSPSSFGATTAAPTASVFEHHDAVTTTDDEVTTKLKPKKDKRKKEKKKKDKKKQSKGKKKSKNKAKK